MCTKNGCLYSNAGPWNSGSDGLKISIPIDKMPTEEGLDNDDNQHIEGGEELEGNTNNLENQFNNVNIS